MQHQNAWQRTLFCCVLSSALAGCTKEQATNAPVLIAEETQLVQDQKVVDGYLVKWDRFAQGENELVPFLRDNKKPFEAALTRLLQAKDKQAPAQMVFYPVVQVGGSIPVDSDLGKACAEIVGGDVTVTKTKKGEQVYFGGDLYVWWEANRDKFEAYPLFDQWSKRDFAKTIVIPMLKSASGKK